MRLFSRSLILCALVFASAFSGVGCGGSSGLAKTEETSTDHLALRELGEAYRLYTISKKKAPKSLAELATVDAVGGNGIEAVRTGRAAIRMDATLPDTGEEPGKVPSSEVLAYETKTPQDGGYVLLLDRTIRKMTPDEFKAAKLAGVEASAAASKK